MYTEDDNQNSGSSYQRVLDKYRPVTPSHLPLVYTCYLQSIARTVSRCVEDKKQASLRIFDTLDDHKDKETDAIPAFCSLIGDGNPREGCLIDKAIVKVMTVHQKESQSIYQKKAKLND